MSTQWLQTPTFWVDACQLSKWNHHVIFPSMFVQQPFYFFFWEFHAPFFSLHVNKSFKLNFCSLQSGPWSELQFLKNNYFVLKPHHNQCRKSLGFWTSRTMWDSQRSQFDGGWRKVKASLLSIEINQINVMQNRMYGKAEVIIFFYQNTSKHSNLSIQCIFASLIMTHLLCPIFMM